MLSVFLLETVYIYFSTFCPSSVPWKMASGYFLLSFFGFHFHSSFFFSKSVSPFYCLVLIYQKKDGFLFQHTWGDIFFFSLCVFFFSSVCFFSKKKTTFLCVKYFFFANFLLKVLFSLHFFLIRKSGQQTSLFQSFFVSHFFFLHFSTFSFITFLFDHFFFHLFVHLFLLFSLFSVLFPLTVLSLLLYLRVTLSFFFSISCFFFFFFSIAVFCVFLRVLTHFFFFLHLILLFFLLVYFFLRFPIFCQTKWKMFVFFFFSNFVFFFCEPSLYLRLISCFSSLRRPLSLFVPCFLIFRVSWCYIPWLSVINLLFGLFKNCRLFLEKSCNKVLWFFFSILFSKIPWCSSFCCQFFLYICFFHATVSWRSLAS